MISFVNSTSLALHLIENSEFVKNTLQLSVMTRMHGSKET